MIDCVESYDTLLIQPTDITLACGDGNNGVEKMTWTSWGTSTAIGQGEFFENMCIPSCAAGEDTTYPVQVMLSGVKPSSHGAYFSELKITWEASRPPNSPPDSYSLTPPSA